MTDNINNNTVTAATPQSPPLSPTQTPAELKESAPIYLKITSYLIIALLIIQILTRLPSIIWYLGGILPLAIF